MYTWYEKAHVCYAYLADVSADRFEERFHSSKWWTRGWTLQELLAPANVMFFSDTWQPFGTKILLKHEIADITSVNAEYLDGSFEVQSASVAKRMSWASSRYTTRGEDIAYCLMGIFSVNMPMLYGEGSKRAFLRLQEEVMKVSHDHSLFAWVSSEVLESQSSHGLLASSPKEFQHSGNIQPYDHSVDRNPYALTNSGLSIKLHLSAYSQVDRTGLWCAALMCPPLEGGGHQRYLGIFIERHDMDHNQYTRVFPHRFTTVNILGELQDIYVTTTKPSRKLASRYPDQFFVFKDINKVLDGGIYVVLHARYQHVNPVHILSPAPTTSLPSWMNRPPLATKFRVQSRAGSLTAAFLIVRTVDLQAFIIMFGSISDNEVGFDVCEAGEAKELPTLVDLQKFFKPKPANQPMDLERHRVQVKLNVQWQAGSKIHDVALIINPKSHGEEKPKKRMQARIQRLRSWK